MKNLTTSFHKYFDEMRAAQPSQKHVDKMRSVVRELLSYHLKLIKVDKALTPKLVSMLWKASHNFPGFSYKDKQGRVRNVLTDLDGDGAYDGVTPEEKTKGIHADAFPTNPKYASDRDKDGAPDKIDLYPDDPKRFISTKDSKGVTFENGRPVLETNITVKRFPDRLSKAQYQKALRRWGKKINPYIRKHLSDKSVGWRVTFEDKGDVKDVKTARNLILSLKGVRRKVKEAEALVKAARQLDTIKDVAERKKKHAQIMKDVAKLRAERNKLSIISKHVLIVGFRPEILKDLNAHATSGVWPHNSSINTAVHEALHLIGREDWYDKDDDGLLESLAKSFLVRSKDIMALKNRIYADDIKIAMAETAKWPAKLKQAQKQVKEKKSTLETVRLFESVLALNANHREARQGREQALQQYVAKTFKILTDGIALHPYHRNDKVFLDLIAAVRNGLDAHPPRDAAQAQRWKKALNTHRQNIFLSRISDFRARITQPHNWERYASLINDLKTTYALLAAHFPAGSAARQDHEDALDATFRQIESEIEPRAFALFVSQVKDHLQSMGFEVVKITNKLTSNQFTVEVADFNGLSIPHWKKTRLDIEQRPPRLGEEPSGYAREVASEARKKRRSERWAFLTARAAVVFRGRIAGASLAAEAEVGVRFIAPYAPLQLELSGAVLTDGRFRLTGMLGVDLWRFTFFGGVGLDGAMLKDDPKLAIPFGIRFHPWRSFEIGTQINKLDSDWEFRGSLGWVF